MSEVVEEQFAARDKKRKNQENRPHNPKPD